MKMLHKRAGFTAIEIIIVSGIIAILSAISIPTYLQARQQAFISSLAAEFRATGEAFSLYSAENNSFPTTSAASSIPDGMATYLPKNSTWTESPKVGGNWYWINMEDTDTGSLDFGTLKGFLVLNGPTISAEKIAEMDERIDNGDLNSGAFQYAAGPGSILYAVD